MHKILETRKAGVDITPDAQKLCDDLELALGVKLCRRNRNDLTEIPVGHVETNSQGYLRVILYDAVARSVVLPASKIDAALALRGFEPTRERIES